MHVGEFVIMLLREQKKKSIINDGETELKVDRIRASLLWCMYWECPCVSCMRENPEEDPNRFLFLNTEKSQKTLVKLVENVNALWNMFNPR